MACRQRNQLITPTREKRISGDDQRLEPLLGEAREGSVDLPFGARVHDTKLQAEGLRCRLHVVRLARGIRIGWVDQSPTAVMPGTSSRNKPSRFAASTLLRKVTPVTLPPGRLRLGMSPALTGSLPIAKTIGIVVVAALAGRADMVPGIGPTPVTGRAPNSFARAGNRS